MTDQIYHLCMEARERGERLRRLRNLANLSRKVLCDQSGININTYIGYEVGRYGGLTKKGAEKIIHYLSSKGVYCSLEWLMFEEGKGPQVITDIKLSNEKETDLVFSALSEEQKINKELMLFHQHYENAVDSKIIDDGMLPLYEVGGYVAGVPCFKEAIKNVVGLNCIVQTKKGEILIRNLRQGRSENTYILTCVNPNTLITSPVLYDVALSFAAEIIWNRKICNVSG
jgi:transcriptional regulator with XRE-family HTH domain